MAGVSFTKQPVCDHRPPSLIRVPEPPGLPINDCRLSLFGASPPPASVICLAFASKISRESAAIFCSTLVRALTWPAFNTAVPGSGKAIRSGFPCAVRGNSRKKMVRAGSICSGSRARRCSFSEPAVCTSAEPFQTATVIAIKDLVAGLARDPEPAAQHRHLLAVQQPGNEFHSFIHLVTLLPGHFALLAKGPIV
jgi:hypothetical protein